MPVVVSCFRFFQRADSTCDYRKGKITKQITGFKMFLSVCNLQGFPCTLLFTGSVLSAQNWEIAFPSEILVLLVLDAVKSCNVFSMDEIQSLPRLVSVSLTEKGMLTKLTREAIVTRVD